MKGTSGLTWSYRPAGARCLRPGCPKPARLHAQNPKLATNYCSTRCRQATERIGARLESAMLANRVRSMLGMNTGRGPHFTLPELRRLVTRLDRVLPGEGMARLTPCQLAVHGRGQTKPSGRRSAA